MCIRDRNKERESSFEIQITVGDKFYAYGFSAVLSRRKVTGEGLYELYQNGSATVSYTHLRKREKSRER